MGKFIHAADIHLDSPLRGLERYEGAPGYVHNATRQAFDSLVELALEEQVDFVLIAGDLYDGDWRDYSTGLYFAARMRRLRDAGIPVFIARGNHDAVSQITRSLSLPDNVCDLWQKGPQTVVLEKLGVAIHGQGYARPAVTDNLVRDYPSPIQGLLNIGLLHTALDGREGHEPYAPCTLSDLLNKGYDYWALGHVHRREVVHQDSPWIVYPGNLQGRHVNETGPKGCTLVTYQDGRITDTVECHLDVLRWTRSVVDCSAAHTPWDILSILREAAAQEVEQAGGRPVVFRFELTGASPAHGALVKQEEYWINQIRVLLSEESGGQGWLEKVKFRTTSSRDSLPADSQYLPRGFLLRYFGELEEDEVLLEAIRAEFAELKAKLPHDLFVHHPDLDLDNPESFREMLAHVRGLAASQLIREEGSSHED